MNIYIKDTSFNITCIIDTYKSFIWTERYNEAGDFELYIPASTSNLNNIKLDYYVYIEDSTKTMIVECIETKTDDEGDFLIISGRSLESLLDRRVVAGSMNTDNTDTTTSVEVVPFSDGIKNLMRKNHLLSKYQGSNDPDSKGEHSNYISDSNIRNIVYLGVNPPACRLYPNNQIYEYNPSSGTKITLNHSYEGDNFYDILTNLCKDKKVGFRIEIDIPKAEAFDYPSKRNVIGSTTNNFVFQCYMGEDRSSEQTKNPVIEVSDNFDNLISSSYKDDKTNYKNTIIMSCEYYTDETTIDKDKTRYYTVTNKDDGSGLTRYETFNSSGVSSSYSEGDEEYTYTKTEYDKKLKSAGNSILSEKKQKSTMDAEVDYNVFVINKDYYLGDRIQINDGYGHIQKALVKEVVYKDDGEGYNIYPTFDLENI